MITKFVFAGMHSLGVLDLQDNRIVEIAPHSFWDLKRISKIDLQNNRLSDICNDIFVNMPTLQIAFITQNQIRSIWPKRYLKK